MSATRLEFVSPLSATTQQTWAWISSFDGVGRELWPWLRMSVPAGVTHLGCAHCEPGRPLFRSWLFVLGIIPFGSTELTLLELTDGVGFVESSPMTGMRQWRHERAIESTAAGCQVRDVLTFDPRWASPVVSWFVRRLFAHRHAVLRRMLRTE